MKTLVLILLATLEVVAGSVLAQATKSPVAVSDLLKIKRANDVEISPDGQYAVYTVNSIIPSQDSKLDYNYRTRIWQIRLEGKDEAQLLDTSDANANAPAYSPSGELIAYTKTVKGQSQVFIYNRQSRQIRQLTSFRYGAANPKWSPDGKRLVFTTTIPLLGYIEDTLLNPGRTVPTWAGGKPGIRNDQNFRSYNVRPDPDGDLQSIKAYLSKNESDRKVKVFTRMQFQGEVATSSEIRLSHVFIVDTAEGAVPQEVTKGFYSFSNPCFIGNNRLAVTARVNEQLHPDDALEEQVYIFQTDGSGSSVLLAKPKTAYAVIAVSPSGKWLAYQQSFPGTVNVPTLHIIDCQAKTAAAYQFKLDRAMNRVRFTDDEKDLYFVAQQNGGACLYKANWVNGKFDKLTSENEGIIDYDVRNGRLVYAKTTVEDPSELFVNDVTGKNEVRLSALNTAWLAERKISVPEKVIFKNSAGLEVEAWIMKPVDFATNRKYPLLLNMHGGPASMWGPGDESMWHEFQYFCGKGIGVVYCNPRGSSGYGERFLKANISDWAAGPASDVLTALNKAIGQGWADTSQLLITGGSYAGYLTCWIIAHDHRFLAASAQRGVYDFHTLFGEGNVWRIIPRYYGGYPWNEKVRRVLDAQSPINYVKNIKTPLLIFSGDNDLRVGQTQSEMLFKSLKVLGKPVEYVQQPGASHEMVRSGDNRQRIDQMLRTYEFFMRYLLK